MFNNTLNTGKLLMVVLLLIGGCRMSFTIAAEPQLQILCPLYQYPQWYDAAEFRFWDKVADASYQVPITVIINPASGPGGGPPNPDYQQGLAVLRSGGQITILGYVDTNRGERPLHEVKADVDLYAEHFEIDGVFFDQVASGPRELAYYQEIYTHVKAANFQAAKMVVINPGNQVYERYLSLPVCDTAVIFENTVSNETTGWPDLSSIQAAREGYLNKYPRTKFGMLIHSVPDVELMKTLLDQTVASNIGYVYITDDTLPNPWDQLPTFWDEIVNDIAGRNQKE